MAGSRTMGSTLTLKKKTGDTAGADIIIAGLTSIGEIAGEREEIDVTTLDSPNGAKEYISGAVDWGSQDIVGNVVNKEHLNALRKVFADQEVRRWEVKTPAGNVLTYDAFISKFGYGEKTTDGLESYNMTLRISGAPTASSTAAARPA